MMGESPIEPWLAIEPPCGLRSLSRRTKQYVDLKTIRNLPPQHSMLHSKGWMPENYPSLPPRVKYFLLTSPSIEPGLMQSPFTGVPNKRRYCGCWVVEEQPHREPKGRHNS